MNLNSTNTTPLQSRLTNLQSNKITVIRAHADNLIKIIQILNSQNGLAPLKIAHFLMGKIKLEGITGLQNSVQEQIRNQYPQLLEEHSGCFSHGTYIQKDLATILKCDILKSGEYFGSWTENANKTKQKLEALLQYLNEKKPVVQDNRNSLISKYENIASRNSQLEGQQEIIENNHSIYKSFISSKTPQEIEHENILKSKSIQINGKLENNVSICKYKHDTHILNTVKHKSSLYNGHIYEIRDNKQKLIYTGPLKLNESEQPEPYIPRKNFKLLTNLGTSIGSHQDASVLCNVHKRVHLDPDNKLLIEGLGSNLQNLISGLAGQVIAYGIDNKIKQGVEFMKGADFVFGSGFSRGGIQLVAQINSSTKKINGAKKIHIFGLDPVAGGGFGIGQAIATLGGLIEDNDNHDEDTETLNEANIIGGMITYSKETNVAFDPKVYNGENYKTFVAHANHQNIDGAEASRKNIPGITTLKRESQMHIGDVMQSLEEKQLILYGFGIFNPTYLSKETESQYLNQDIRNPNNEKIVNTSVMPGGGAIGYFINDRTNLLARIPPLDKLY